MNRLSYIFLPLTAIGMSACSSGKEEVKRPNIIFMMTDDHTTQAMSCYGGRFLQTPNMDRIANEGVRMDNCYAVNALSGPSRACILTGKFSHINGFTDNASTFDGNQQTFPKLLQAAVYWGFNSTLLLSMTSPLNLPAPGRCQAVYWIFRFGTALCFC